MKKILIVAMADSVHTARWLEQFEKSNYEFVLFPSSPHRRIHPKIIRLLSDTSPMKITIPRGLKRTGLILTAIDKLAADNVRGFLLRRLIEKFQPNILHALETQGAGYISLAALEGRVSKPFFVLTLWGSDLFWFRRFKRHRFRLQKLMGCIDLLSMECQRDQSIARDLGYSGKFFPPFPVTGGYEMSPKSDTRNLEKTSQRKIVLVKGHTRFVGRGTKALEAIAELADLLKNYEIVVYSADPKAKRMAHKIADGTKIAFRIYGRGEIAHQDLLEIFRSARIYVGISLSDGISVSLQEALVCGAFPIQTDTSCAGEWIIDGETGFIVSPDDSVGLVQAIRTALVDDQLVDAAAEKNYEVARSRLDQSVVSEISTSFYEVLN